MFGMTARILTATQLPSVSLAKKRALPWVLVTLSVVAGPRALALGTDAGREITNTASASFEISGVSQTPVASAPAVVFVDELLDATVTFDNGGPVPVASPATGAIMQFTLTNTGNGSEAFRIVADDAVAGDDFDPTLDQIYLESNGLAGLQTGPGGDTPYLLGSNDPVLAADGSQVVYVTADMPAAQAQNAQGLLQVRAVPVTVFTEAGTDDPAAVAFPTPGTAYAGAGDLDELGGGNVTAVVGTSFDGGNLVLRGEGIFQVSGAIVTITKQTLSQLDPFGGATLVPGTVISYRITVTVAGSGTAENLVVTDPLPAELEYQPGTLAVSALPAGEDADDDFAPIGTDNTGFDSGNGEVRVTLGDVAGGAGAITIDFDAAIL